MPKFDETNAVLENGIWLPNFLFFFDNSKSKNISPTATFNPATAIDGGGFENSTSPSKKPVKKTLIITKSAFFPFSLENSLPIILKLKSLGFELFLCCNKNGEKNLIKVADLKQKKDAKLLATDLENLAFFNEKTDFELATKANIARDKTAIINYLNQNDIINSLTQNTGGEYGLFANSLEMAYEVESEQINFKTYQLQRFSKERLLENFQNINENNLTNFLSAAPQFANQLIEQYGDKIKDSSDLFIYLEAAPQFANQLIEQYGDKIKDSSDLFIYLEAAPQFAKQLIEKYGDKIEDSYDLAQCLKAAPQFAKQLIKDHGDKIQNGTHLAKLLKAVPQLAEQLIKDHGDKIQNVNDLARCLKAAPQFAKQIIEKHPNKIIDFDHPILHLLNAKPTDAKAIIEKHNDSINSYNLDQFLEAAPQLAEQLIEKYGDKIKDYYNLAACLKAAPQLAIAKQLIEKYGDKIKDSYNLAQCLKAAPQFAELIIEKYGDKFDLEPQNISRIQNKFIDLSSQTPIENNKPHLLYLKDNIGEFLTRIESENKTEILSEIAVVKIEKATIKNIDEIKSFLSQLPKLYLVLVPKEIKQQIAQGFPQLIVYDINSSTKKANNQTSTPIKPQTNKIKIAQGRSNKNQVAVDKDEAQTFQMETSGEILNNSLNIKPQIRTSIIKQKDILNNVEQEEYFAQSFTEITNLITLSDEDIESFQTANTEQLYYQFSQKLTANQTTRLFSADASEEFAGIVGQTNGVEIFKGDDDFFYAKAKSDCNLSYVLKAPNPNIHQTNFGNIDKENPIKKIINEYRSKTTFSTVATDKTEKANYNASQHDESMDRIFNENLGVCRHRVAALEYKLTKAGIEKENFRSVSINNNHVILEIKYREKWIQVDLGGGEGNEVDLENQEQKSDLAEPKQTLQELIEEVRIEPANGNNHEESKHDNFNIVSQENIQQKALAKMATSLLAVTEIEKIDDENSLKTKTIDSDKGKILIVANDIESNANFLTNQAVASNRKVFYLNNSNQIDIGRINLLIKSGNPTLSEKEGLLSNFLNLSEEEKQNKPLLIINWSAFSNQEKLALNTVLDIKKSINGVEIDSSIQIVGLSNSMSQDPSFLSRHDLSVQSDVVLLNQNEAKDLTSETLQIDLQGFENWRRQLFGKVILQGDEMIWQKSEFVEAIENVTKSMDRHALLDKARDDGNVYIKKDASVNNGNINFQLSNLSTKAKEEFEREFKQAKAQGKFIYHGYEVILPNNINITFSDKDFDFAKFSDDANILLEKNTTLNELPQGFVLINTYLFDLLLSDKKIEEGKYIEEIGLIDKCAKSEDKEKILKLFISSDLSDNQWYCLFNEALQKNVKLQIATAPEVKIPALVKIKEAILKEDTHTSANAKSFSASQIFVSNDANQTLTEILSSQKSSQQPFAIVDVEDFSYQDLIEKITFETTPNGFKNFEKIESEFLTKLKAGEKIILKGQFSKELLQMLEPIITCQAPEFEIAGRNLTLIIEDENCQVNEVYKPLKWLAPNNYEVKNHDVKEGEKTNINHREIAENSTDLTNSKEKSDTFINQRKQTFLETLQNNSMTRLVGHSGVGKSRLLKMFEENSEEQHTSEVYRELNAFENWANSKSEKTKILFIDESNIEDLHFTMFSPLKNNGLSGQKRMFYGGKFYDLDENHKVVFAQNPSNYGGGRFEQKLFDDGRVPVIYLNDFPASYIYEKILKNAIYDKLNAEAKTKIDENKFKEICQPLIENYQKANSQKKSDDEANNETVRELQEKTLIELCSIVSPKQEQEIKSKNYISTSATSQVEEALINSLEIRKLQKSEVFPNKSVGLNGVLLEGDSGTGKSELISAVLASRGITKKEFSNLKNNEIEVDIFSDDNDAIDLNLNNSPQQFYKIDANLPIEQKKQIITRAFEEGNIVWIDEINSCIDDGLEKILNAALTGDHPQGKESAKVNAGFMLISSVNSASLEGRSLISPALKHRTIQPKVNNLRQYSPDDLSKIINHWLLQENENTQTSDTEKITPELTNLVAQNIAKDFVECLKTEEGKSLNLRMLRNSLTEIMPAYVWVPNLHLSQNPIISDDPNSINISQLQVAQLKLIDPKSPGKAFEKY